MTAHKLEWVKRPAGPWEELHPVADAHVDDLKCDMAIICSGAAIGVFLRADPQNYWVDKEVWADFLIILADEGDDPVYACEDCVEWLKELGVPIP